MIIRPQWLLSLSHSYIPGPKIARPTVLLLLIFPRPTRVSTRLVWLRRWIGTWNERVLWKIGCFSPSAAGVRFVFTLCPEKTSVILTRYSAKWYRRNFLIIFLLSYANHKSSFAFNLIIGYFSITGTCLGDKKSLTNSLKLSNIFLAEVVPLQKSYKTGQEKDTTLRRTISFVREIKKEKFFFAPALF